MMIRRGILFAMICFTLWSVGRMLGPRQESVVSVRMERVKRADVHQVAAISGRLVYDGETFMYASMPGVIKRICVKAGQRVETGEMLICLDSKNKDTALAAMYQHLPQEELIALSTYAQTYLAEENTVIRAQERCTVRQVLVEEGAPVTAGMPVMRATTGQQHIVCSLPAEDGRKMREGMWAWLTDDAQPLGTAVVQMIGQEEADPTTGLLYRRVTLRPDMVIDLPEGTVIDAEVYIAGSDDVLSLPVEAITERETVWWVNEGRCTEIQAPIVLCDEMRAWVDLPEGIQVAVGEFMEGQRVVEAEY